MSVRHLKGRAPDPPRCSQGEVVAALRDRSFYPHRPDRVEVIETHVSWVFLAGELAFKLKKAVRLPFLDYSSARDRKLMCEEELRLNRRLAPATYLGVRGIVKDGHRLVLGHAEDPAVVDHVVEMRRFRESDTLAQRLDTGRAGLAELAVLGRMIASFHARARVVRAPEAARDRVSASLHETLHTLEALGGGALEGAEVAAARRFADGFLAAERPLLESRLSEGRIREGHGDLRLEHVVLGDSLEIVDCVEFDVRLRELDVAADLAFPLMELEQRGRSDGPRALLNAYREGGGDPGPPRLVGFYATERAWVRAKVALVRGDQLGAGSRGEHAQAARSLFALGRRLAWTARPRSLLVVCGPPAAGKSTLARALADASGYSHLSSDRVRKELAGVPPDAPAPAAAYDDAAVARTYAELAARAERELGAGRGVILDATYRRRAERVAVRSLAARLGSPVLFVEWAARAELRLLRAATRAGAPSESDASPAVAAPLAGELEPLDELPARERLVVRTDRPVGEAVPEVEAGLDERWEARAQGARKAEA